MSRASARPSRRAYPRESLAAAAALLGDRARVSLSVEGKNWRVAVESARGAAELLGELLNEALSHARRQSRLKEARALTAAVAARLLERGFPAAPADPLEELEPQVRRDRAEEAATLLEAARRLA